MDSASIFGTPLPCAWAYRPSDKSHPTCAPWLGLVRSGAADLGISAISITAAREAEFDFSLPMLNAGLEIMVRGSGPETTSRAVVRLLREVFSPAGLF